MVTRLVIKQLYGHYNYDLDFSQNLNVKILLGPNGFGKSTILKTSVGGRGTYYCPKCQK